MAVDARALLHVLSYMPASGVVDAEGFGDGVAGHGGIAEEMREEPCVLQVNVSNGKMSSNLKGTAYLDRLPRAASLERRLRVSLKEYIRRIPLISSGLYSPHHPAAPSSHARTSATQAASSYAPPTSTRRLRTVVTH